MYTSYDNLLEMTLRKNQLTLFDLDGKEKRLDYQYHVSEHVRRPKGVSAKMWRVIALQLTVDIWASWEIHLKNSTYSLPHFGGVHVEERWLQYNGNSPPCIILFNQPIFEEGEKPMELPVQINWKCEQTLGPLDIRSFVFNVEGANVRAWRIYLSR